MGGQEVGSSTRKFAGCWVCHDLRSHWEIWSIDASYARSACSGCIPRATAVESTSWELCVAARKWGVSMNIQEFKVVISFWCCDAKLMEIREPDVI